MNPELKQYYKLESVYNCQQPAHERKSSSNRTVNRPNLHLTSIISPVSPIICTDATLFTTLISVMKNL